MRRLDVSVVTWYLDIHVRWWNKRGFLRTRCSLMRDSTMEVYYSTFWFSTFFILPLILHKKPIDSVALFFSFFSANYSRNYWEIRSKIFISHSVSKINVEKSKIKKSGSRPPLYYPLVSTIFKKWCKNIIPLIHFA